MFEKAEARPIDKIIAVSRAYAADKREDKVDFGIGVYKDELGRTPIMRSVKEAERRLQEEQQTKTYVGVGGDLRFVQLLSGMVLPEFTYGEEMQGIQTLGGSGAVRVLAELAHQLSPAATFWLPEPTWPNHLSILGAIGVPIAFYPYPKYEAEPDIEAILHTLDRAEPGDVVVLHAGCHNPTGIDPSPDALAELTTGLAARKLTPFVDAAYIGFGTGFAADARRIEIVAENAPEILVALSCSKNFGIYRERTGAALIVSKSGVDLGPAHSSLLSIARASYSMPPDHGASIVRTILEDAELEKSWRDELEHIRNRINGNRRALALALARARQDRDWTYIDKGFGMFSLIDVSPEGVAKLAEEQAIYIIPDGRMNIAAIDTEKVDEIAAKLASVL